MLLDTLEVVRTFRRSIKMIPSGTIYCESLISDIATCIFAHNTTRECWIIVTLHVCGWCLASASKSKCHIRVFPLCFQNIPFFVSVYTSRSHAALDDNTSYLASYSPVCNLVLAFKVSDTASLCLNMSLFYALCVWSRILNQKTHTMRSCYVFLWHAQNIFLPYIAYACCVNKIT